MKTPTHGDGARYGSRKDLPLVDEGPFGRDGEMIHTETHGTRGSRSQTMGRLGSRNDEGSFRPNDRNIDEAWQFFDGRELPGLNVQTTDRSGRRNFGHLLDRTSYRKGKK